MELIYWGKDPVLCDEHDWNKKKRKWRCMTCGKTRRARSSNAKSKAPSAEGS